MDDQLTSVARFVGYGIAVALGMTIIAAMLLALKWLAIALMEVC